jgi:hypothetical protein
MQHPLILPDAALLIWGECTDVFHAEAEGSAKNANGLIRQHFPANRFLTFLSGVPEQERPAPQSTPPEDLAGVALTD